MFEAKKFNIPELVGISAKSIKEHVKLYEGYVTHVNLVMNKIKELSGADMEANMGLISGLQRRLSFEYNGMRNHEIYFSLLEGGPNKLADGSLKNAIVGEWGSFENFLNSFKTLATIRGIGWVILYFDKKQNKLINAWVDEQHLGQLQEAVPIIALDMWEHSYVYDYATSEKAKYIEAFFANIDWSVAEGNFTD